MDRGQEINLKKMVKEYVVSYDKFILEDYSNKNKDYSGVLPFCPRTKRFLLNLRSSVVNNPNVYSSWGGKIELGESSEQTAMREFEEESGYKNDGEDLLFLYKSEKIKLDYVKSYYLYSLMIDSSFKPTLDFESDSYKWATLSELYEIDKEKFHPEFYKTLINIKDKLMYLINI
jgi:8-oxo-dGTP pyrophosphatase MutT (NUDIX family)